MHSPRYTLECEDLTPSQANVLLWLAEGKTQREIASAFSVSHKTIEIHLRFAKERLGARTPAEALAICFSRGYMKERLLVTGG
ncbi:helix-turn-helix transcriptional regulator [Thalassotalea sp. G20_0]|uniref:helix-turn-helix domain-containing protein n=1 Tax=Thalassotalea sp. G20_0 TaxID=2821093 RepID=UPI001ADA51F8|nr:helix-turn-helix transcriptional regulator [Thalassotalea sp. G20_0]MBO9493818.1 helix-turn-helix transcriptional regulator [Thalassotalea sp. G20_0]